MFPLIKFLKIVLPVATVTSATIVTVSLVSSKKEDEILDSTREDRVLNDIEKPAERFEEQIMLYSEDGTQESKTITKEELERISKTKLDNETKGPSASTPTREPSGGASVEPKSEDVPSQMSSIDVNGVLSDHLQESDKKVIENEADTNSPLTKLEENTDEGQDNEVLGTSQPLEAKTQDLSLSSVDMTGNKRKESEGGDDRGEQQSEEHERLETSSLKGDDNKEVDLENKKSQKTSEKNLAEEGNRDLLTEDASDKNTVLDGRVASDSQTSSDQQTNENIGGDSVVNSSSGQENGLQGEYGQGPMTPEQLQRIAAMGAEVETVLGALGSLFRGSF